jgi:hypothetical protein
MGRAYDSQAAAGSLRWAAGPNNSAVGPDMTPLFGCAEFWHSTPSKQHSKADEATGNRRVGLLGLAANKRNA